LPLSCAVCGEFAALSLTVNVPVRPPSAVGVNVTRIWHLPLAASVFGAIGQVDVATKSPEAEMLLIASGTVRVLVRTMDLATLVVCMTRLPNPILVGLKV